METRSVEAIIRTLNGASVRYLVAGGLAVVAHGYVRFTADIDLIVDLDPENVRRATAALAKLGYRPRAPVRLEEFADPVKRAEWIRDKGLTVFSLFSADHSATELDLFVEVPLDFEQAYRAAARMEVAPGVVATFLGLAELMRLKRQAGRTQDLLDIEKLQLLHEEKNRE
jgi:hypothetical protein